jgi:23S rRNA (adenine2503-C2)-methyltransferase
LPNLIVKLLEKNFLISVPEIISKNISQDGTRKYLMRIDGGHEIETVYIPKRIGELSA